MRSSSDTEAALRSTPKVKRYSLESRTSCKFFLPDGVAGALDGANDLLLRETMKLSIPQPMLLQAAEQHRSLVGVDLRLFLGTSGCHDGLPHCLSVPDFLSNEKEGTCNI